MICQTEGADSDCVAPPSWGKHPQREGLTLEEVGPEVERRPLEPSQYPSYLFLTASFAGTCGGADPLPHHSDADSAMRTGNQICLAFKMGLKQ